MSPPQACRRALFAPLALAICCGSMASCATYKSTQAGSRNGAKAVAFIRYYEGPNGWQDTFCPEVIDRLPYFRQGRICKNDEAKSLKFENTPPGTKVFVYDNPNCDTGDDWAEITTLRWANPPITVYHFEDNDSDDPTGYIIRYHYQDGNLDGKVSCRIVDVPAPSK